MYDPTGTTLQIKIILYCAVPENNLHLPYGRSSEIPWGRGVLKVKILEAKYEAKLEFPGGRGNAKQKTFCGWVMDIFWICAIIYYIKL